MAHSKRMPKLNGASIVSLLTINSTKRPYFSPLTPTYVMILHLHLPFHIHYRRHFPQLQYVLSCLWQNLYILGMVMVSNLEPLRGFQAQSMVSVFIKIGPYAESIVHLKFFLVS